MSKLKKVLLIDDDLDLRRIILERIVEADQGIQFIILDNTLEANQYLAQGDITHLVVDLHLGSSEGDEFIRSLNCNKFKDLNIALFTGDENHHAWDRIEHKHMKYLYKPDWDGLERFLGIHEDQWEVA